MKNIVRLANQFILLRGVDRLPLDMERLRMLCAAEKLVLLSYGEAEGLIESLALQAHTKRNAFLLQTQDVGLVLYKDTLPLGAKLFAIAHELGHCFLGHTFYGVREQNLKTTRRSAKPTRSHCTSSRRPVSCGSGICARSAKFKPKRCSTASRRCWPYSGFAATDAPTGWTPRYSTDSG